MRYRIDFLARENPDFKWTTSEHIETDDLLELIFRFQVMIAQEFKRIIAESKKLEVDDDIPF